MRRVPAACSGVLLLASGALAAETVALAPEVKAFVKVEAAVVVLRHLRVVDGTGAAALEDQTIVVSEGRIRTIGSGPATRVQEGAQVLDLAGHTALPGLVGMHDHMYYPAPGRVSIPSTPSASPASTSRAASPPSAPPAAWRPIPISS